MTCSPNLTMVSARRSKYSPRRLTSEHSSPRLYQKYVMDRAEQGVMLAQILRN